MKRSGLNLIVVLLGLIFFVTSSIVSAQSLYIDPINGDNRNPGTSPATAIKGTGPINSIANSYMIGKSAISALQQTQADGESSGGESANTAPQLERILLGPRPVSWKEFAPVIWHASLALQPGWTLQGANVAGDELQPGCAADFLAKGQFFWQDEMLYINQAEGNPEIVTISAYNYDTDEYRNIDVVGWSSSPPSVWQAEFPTTPIHVFIDDMLVDQNWWYGPSYCDGGLTGMDGFLYLRDSDGNPDQIGKATAAIADTGGWAVTSGDFNGDGYSDVVHSDSGLHIYINYGEPDISPSPSQILASPDEETVFGYFVASAGDVNNDGFDDLVVSMGWGLEKVYLYMGSDSGLGQSPSQVLTPPDGVPAFGFGHGIAGNGSINGDAFSDILIMGGDDSSAYLCVYLGSSQGIDNHPNSVMTFTDKGYGGSVCIAGDMNKDGYDDVALSMSGTPANEIEIRIYNGSSSGTLANPNIMYIDLPDNLPYAHGEVAPAGDINADGFADLVVGNQWAQGNYANEGMAYLILGSASGPGGQPNTTIMNPTPAFNARFGSTVAGVGDFNLDGHNDLAVGCPYGQEGNGFVAIYSGSAEGISDAPSRTITGVDSFGWSVSGAGDIKGSGQAYLIAGEESGAGYLFGEEACFISVISAKDF